MSRTIELQNIANPATMYARIATTLLKRGKGNLPDITIHLKKASILPEALKKYNKVCGFDHTLIIPATYLHAYIFPLHTQLLSQPEVPFPLPGLIHFANSIQQQRPLYIGEEFSVTCKFGNLVAHDKGQAFEVISYLEVSGKRIWEDTSIYLFKGREGIGSVLEWEQPVLHENCIKESWSLYQNLGIEFAMASGDFNPIHLHPLTAKVFGFERHIIHGMWSAGKILALLEKRMPQAFEFTVLFKTPIYLPASVIFRHEKTENGFDFDIVDHTQEKPHLKGYLTAL
ncbi:MAG: MaoC/PaaZ C-terminal domain-containing protein [Chitinophagales bacterium]